MNKDDQAEYDKLNGLSGKDFDTEYIPFILKAHWKKLHDFYMEASVAVDPTLATTVVNAMRMMHDHLGMIAQVAKQDGITLPPRPPRPPSHQCWSTTTSCCGASGEAIRHVAECGKRAFGPSFLCGVKHMGADHPRWMVSSQEQSQALLAVCSPFIRYLFVLPPPSPSRRDSGGKLFGIMLLHGECGGKVVILFGLRIKSSKQTSYWVKMEVLAAVRGKVVMAKSLLAK